ncbi:MAG: Lrp/AsnC family transcriptional regulator [Pseudorhodoplanes sp.]
MDLDNRDLLLLSVLTRDARTSLVDLAQQVHLSPSACARRQRALEERKVIVGYQAVLGLPQLGLSTTVIVRIRLDHQREDALEKFEKAIARCPSVTRCLLMAGTDDYLVLVLARDIEDFERIHRTELSRLPGVSRIESSFVIREIVNRSFPPAALRTERQGASEKR